MTVTVEQANKVDFIATIYEDNAVVLYISDHLDWIDSTYHMESIQKKIYAYLDFIEGNELEEYSNKLTKPYKIDICVEAMLPIPEKLTYFYESIADYLEKKSIGFNISVASE